jgi:fructose-bisphosphate aldolase, class I
MTMTTTQRLQLTARRLVARGQGILAVDESTKTCNSRFAKLGIEPTEENRRAYRELLLTAPGLGAYVSGAILYDETLRQSCRSGERFVKAMCAAGLLAGIKVDTGTVPFDDSEDEVVTEGLDGLADRVAEYVSLGARFAKWRAVLRIAEGTPTLGCIQENSRRLAAYARICQEGELVPIVEPEVLMDGDHTAQTCYAATSEVWGEVFRQLKKEGVDLEAVIFKCSMVIAGQDCALQADVTTVADHTLACLERNVPRSVAGVAFLSGGQSDRLATEHLNQINCRAHNPPWPLTFSYGRALQQPAIDIWRGDPRRVEQAQQALLARARFNSAASRGAYSAEIEELEYELTA